MEFDFIAFDMQRMWLGDGDLLFLLEIVVRASVIFIYAIFLLRVLGNEGMKDMNFLDYFMVIALGSAAGDPMFYPSVPLIYGLVTITVVIGLKYILAKLTLWSEVVENFVEPKPICIIQDGVLQEDHLRDKKLTKESLFSQLRIAGIENLGQVRVCYLEPNGEISLFKYNNADAYNGLPIVPPTRLA